MEVLKVAYSLNKTGRFSKCCSIAAVLQLVQNTVCLQDSNVTPCGSTHVCIVLKPAVR